MRGALTAVLFFLTACILVGMSSLGGTPEGEIPKTDENIRVNLLDRAGVTSELSRFSMDGNLFLKGKRGDGEVSVSFRNLKEVTFGAVSGNGVLADLVQKSGNRVQIVIEKSAVFFGDTGYGAYRITADGVSRITIHR